MKTKKHKKIDTVLLTIYLSGAFCLIFMLVVFLVLVKPFYIMNTDKYNGLSNDDIENFVLKCENLDLENSVKCLNTKVKEIFNYRIHKNNEILTFQELQDKGGNCKDWSELYYKSLEKLGFVSHYSIIKDNTVEHQFIVVLNSGILCIVDMENYMCKEYVW